jgi:hypothetical protein
MALFPLQIPAGVYGTGTELDAQGRWLDANLVRWTNGSLRPVGGWELRTDATSSATASPRAVHAWKDNTAGSNLVFGTSNELVYMNESGTQYDITPVSFNTGNDSAAINVSFGGTYFGTGAYGTKRPNTGEYQEVDTWSLDNWGEYLVGCSTSDGKLYEWQLDTLSPATQIANSPEDCKGLVVTEERFIFALGADNNPRRVAWCDREDNTTWTPTALNEAGDIELQTNGEIMAGTRLRGRTLILTNTDAHVASYIGSPYVYGFERVGTACGISSRKSLIAIEEGAFWAGKEAFFYFDGSTVRKLTCEVQDKIFCDINHNQITKMFALHNSQFGEVWWFYPSSESTEIDSYVAFDYMEQHWTIGKLDRTCGLDAGVFDEAMWFDADGNLYEHERTNLPHGDSKPYAETGLFMLGNGDQVMRATQLISDECVPESVQVKFKTKFYPNGEETEHGVYTLDEAQTPVRFTGRQAKMRIEATGNNNWRVGTFKLNLEAGGKR